MNSADPSILAGITFGAAIPTLVLLSLFHKHSPFNFWAPVVEKYQTLNRAGQFDCRWQSLRVGFMHFGGIVKGAFLPEGLFIGLAFPFGLFEKDVLIPWRDIQIIAADRFGGKVSLGKPPFITVWMSNGLFKGIEQRRGTAK